MLWLAGELLTVRLPMYMSTGLLMYGYEILNESDTIIIGAGAGLSTSADFTYTGKRFKDNFIENYGFKDMYSGGFYPFESLEEHWAYWSRYIYINRYIDVDNGTYKRLYELVKDKDYFVLTTNVGHKFQKAGFDKHRLFYTQGDYGMKRMPIQRLHMSVSIMVRHMRRRRLRTGLCVLMKILVMC